MHQVGSEIPVNRPNLFRFNERTYFGRNQSCFTSKGVLETKEVMPMKKRAAPSQSNPKFKFTSRSKDLPASQGMLHLVRSELKADIRGLHSEMNSRFDQVDARFNQIDARFNQIDSRFKQMDSKFSQMDSKFNQMDSKFEQVLSAVARVGTGVEEQNSRNRVVLEGLTGLWQRQDRLETRVDKVESTVRSIARPRT
jgi:chromosome segregation ATPase